MLLTNADKCRSLKEQLQDSRQGLESAVSKTHHWRRSTEEHQALLQQSSGHASQLQVQSLNAACTLAKLAVASVRQIALDVQLSSWHDAAVARTEQMHAVSLALPILMPVIAMSAMLSTRSMTQFGFISWCS